MKKRNQQALPAATPEVATEPTGAATEAKSVASTGLKRNLGLGVIAALGVAGFLLLSGDESGVDPAPLAVQPATMGEPALTPAPTEPQLPADITPVAEPLADAEPEPQSEPAPKPGSETTTGPAGNTDFAANSESATDAVAADDPSDPSDPAAAIKVDLREAVLFPAGSAELDPAAVATLTEAAETLKQSPHQTLVAGYADDTEISPRLAAKYPTNWELASARAASVVRLLEQQGVPATQLLAVSYGDNHPIASNATVRGRELNRRIEIIQQQEPVAIN